MKIRLLGAALVIFGCGFIGRLLVLSKRDELSTARELILMLDNLACELQYRITPLPELCNIISEQTKGTLKQLFAYFADELNGQISPNVQICMASAIKKTAHIPYLTKKYIILLGETLGHYELEGQLKGIQTVRDECARAVESFSKDLELRMRCYQSLSLCAGAALAILLI